MTGQRVGERVGGNPSRVRIPYPPPVPRRARRRWPRCLTGVRDAGACGRAQPRNLGLRLAARGGRLALWWICRRGSGLLGSHARCDPLGPPPPGAFGPGPGAAGPGAAGPGTRQWSPTTPRPRAPTTPSTPHQLPAPHPAPGPRSPAAPQALKPGPTLTRTTQWASAVSSSLPVGVPAGRAPLVSQAARRTPARWGSPAGPPLRPPACRRPPRGPCRWCRSDPWRTRTRPPRPRPRRPCPAAAPCRPARTSPAGRPRPSRPRRGCG
jgi:hypothetical protein